MRRAGGAAAGRSLPGAFGLAGAVAAALGTAAGVAIAQPADNETAFSVERFVPPPGPGTFLVGEDAEVLGHLDLAIGVAGSLASRPLVFADILTGEEVSEPVRLRLGWDLTAAVGLGARYQVGFGLPLVAAQTGDRLRGIGLEEDRLARVALGDLRLHAKARVVGEPAAPGLGVAVAATVTLPTGDGAHFAGEKGAVVEWRLVGAYRTDWGRAALNVGPRIRAREVVLLSPARPHGNELAAALAGELIVPWTRRQLRALGELTVVEGDGGGPSPGEARLGASWRLPSGWSFGAAAGVGITPSEVGAPAWRVAATLRWESRPTTDLDRDGIPDWRDLCPFDAEDFDGFEDDDGCPDEDNDGDGIPDPEDLCPNQPEDFDGWRDGDGCPDPDDDGDGILDDDDLCPRLIGPPEHGGCPAPEPPDPDSS